MPKISVIVPVYNVENYLHRCVDSILAQSFTDFELILVDDGSPDNCGRICDEYAEKDNRIHVIHKENGGLSDARNAGIDWAIEHSDSEWISFIDSDDWIHPKYLEALYNAVKETGCDISICAYEQTEGETPLVDEAKLIVEVVDTELFFCEHNVNAVIACGKLYKKELFRDIRYPVGKLHEDEFTTYKLLFQYRNCAFVNQPMYFYFINKSSITKSDWTLKKLDGLEAKYIQLEFFSSNGYVLAERTIIESIAERYCFHINKIGDKQEYYAIKRQLRRKLKRHLIKYKKINDFSIKTSPLYYNNAYPHLSKYYWIIRSKLQI